MSRVMFLTVPEAGYPTPLHRGRGEGCRKSTIKMPGKKVVFYPDSVTGCCGLSALFGVFFLLFPSADTLSWL